MNLRLESDDLGTSVSGALGQELMFSRPFEDVEDAEKPHISHGKLSSISTKTGIWETVAVFVVRDATRVAV